VSLKINEDKTEYMEVRRRLDGRQTEEFLKVGFYCFKKVSEFKYLATIITQLNNVEYEILKRIHMGNKCYYEMVTYLIQEHSQRN
jgi:hypothetical protein